VLRWLKYELIALDEVGYAQPAVAGMAFPDLLVELIFR
jgi:hypothetical protein